MLAKTTALSLALPLWAASPALAGEVWTVSSNGAGSDFASIQDAIDAAGDGDTLLLQSGSYNEYGLIDDKALTIVVDGQQSAQAYGLTVSNLAAGKEVFVAGLDGTLHATDCAGRVIFERCGITFYDGSSVVDCSGVTFIDCALRGNTGSRDEDGEPGLVVDDSSVTLYRSTARGGDGGDSICLGVAGDGGDGLVVINGSAVRAVESEFEGGYGGWTCGQPTGAWGEDVFVDGSSSFALQTTPPLRLIGPDVVREGESFTLRIEGPVGDLAYLLTSTELQYRVLPPAVGILHTATPFDLVLAGTIPASGLLTVPFTAPDLAPGDESRVRYVQSFLSGGGARYLTNPKALVVIDGIY